MWESNFTEKSHRVSPFVEVHSCGSRKLLKFSSHFQGFSVSTALFLDVPEDMYIYMGGIKERNTIEAVAIDTSSLLQALHTFLRRIPLFGQLHHKNIGC